MKGTWEYSDAEFYSGFWITPKAVVLNCRQPHTPSHTRTHLIESLLRALLRNRTQHTMMESSLQRHVYALNPADSTEFSSPKVHVSSFETAVTLRKVAQYYAPWQHCLRSRIETSGSLAEITSARLSRMHRKQAEPWNRPIAVVTVERRQHW